MEFFKDVMTYDFLKLSLISTFLISLLTSLVSPIIVYKRMEFVGDGLAHAIFAGVALAVLLNFKIFIGAIATTAVFAYLIYRLNNSTQISESTAIGMLLPVFMSIGIILFSKTDKYTSDVLSYLFGNLLLILPFDVYFLIVITTVTIVFIALKRYEILYWISDENMAKFYGIKTDSIKFYVLLLISFVVVSSLKIAGVVVMGAFLVLPGVFAKRTAKSFEDALKKGIIFSLSTSFFGFLLAYYFDTPPGPTIVLTSFAILTLLLKLR